MDSKIDNRTPEQKLRDLLNDPEALEALMKEVIAEQKAKDDKGGDGTFAVPEIPIDL